MEIELERRYVLLNGQKYEPEQIDEMTVSEIDALSFSLRAKSESINDRLQDAKALKKQGDPMDEATFSFLRKASRQIGLSIAYLAAVKKQKNRESNEAVNQELLRVLHDYVGDSVFQSLLSDIREAREHYKELNNNETNENDQGR